MSGRALSSREWRRGAVRGRTHRQSVVQKKLGNTPFFWCNWSFMKIAIIGLGYVGLPLCLQFARSGVQVLGLDIDAEKVRALNAGHSYIKHIRADEIKRLVRAGKFSATTNFAQIRGVQAVLICVPTP